MVTEQSIGHSDHMRDQIIPVDMFWMYWIDKKIYDLGVFHISTLVYMHVEAFGGSYLISYSLFFRRYDRY